MMMIEMPLQERMTRRHKTFGNGVAEKNIKKKKSNFGRNFAHFLILSWLGSCCRSLIPSCTNMTATFDPSYTAEQLHADIEAGKVSGFYGGSYISSQGYKRIVLPIPQETCQISFSFGAAPHLNTLPAIDFVDSSYI